MYAELHVSFGHDIVTARSRGGRSSPKKTLFFDSFTYPPAKNPTHSNFSTVDPPLLLNKLRRRLRSRGRKAASCLHPPFLLASVEACCVSCVQPSAVSKSVTCRRTGTTHEPTPNLLEFNNLSYQVQYIIIEGCGRGDSTKSSTHMWVMLA